MKVELSDQVLEFVRSQSPESRKRLRRAIRKLALEQGDIKNLEGPLSSYQRLRVGPFRIIFTRAAAAGRPPSVQCVFAERRGVVYTVLSRMLEDEVLGDRS